MLDSRPALDGTSIRRRRECSNCGKRFTTYEYIEQIPLMVIKRDGRREPYERQKLLNGLLLACRKRPISRERIENLVTTIESKLSEDSRIEVSTSELGEMVLEQLIDFDPVAYVRFASVYRQFDSPEQFVEELNKLKERRRRWQSQRKE